MLLKPVSFSDPAHNLLYDDALLQMAEETLTDDILRLWESPVPFVVLGRICDPLEDLVFDRVAQDNIPVLRRSSGGGTVLQGPGCLNFSLVLKKDRHPGLQDLHTSYEYILGRISRALERLGIPTVFHPVADLALKSTNKKISGNAQRRRRHYILHHGTLLYAMDGRLMSRYLRMPRIVPEYRQGRNHADFTTVLPCASRQLQDAVIQEFAPDQREDKMREEEKMFFPDGTF